MAEIVLSEQDNELITLLGQCGIMHRERALQFYGDSMQAPIRRLDRLVSANMIVREKGYVRPTPTGLKQVGIIDESPYRMPKIRYEEHALAVDLAFSLPGWAVTYARQLKQENAIMLNSRIALSLRKDDLLYMMYIITDNPRNITLSQIITEMSKLARNGMQRLIVFCTTEAIQQTFTRALAEPPGSLTELCLLPYPDGIKYFLRARSKALEDALIKGIKGLGKAVGHASGGVDYEIVTSRSRFFVSVLVDNDLVKKSNLARFVNSEKTHNPELKNVQFNVVHVPGQEIDIPDVKLIPDRILAPGKISQPSTDPGQVEIISVGQVYDTRGNEKNYSRRMSFYRLCDAHAKDEKIVLDLIRQCDSRIAVFLVAPRHCQICSESKILQQYFTDDDQPNLYDKR